ncbi:MAG: orotidine-5'-phosphate decarboxylase [Candidatus Nomurabacteria bacterium]|jgi:orotidine-5'-phosphate decarboxylase|nr:orotidine-5'-phosphate decarboxylase [Candidatus Nomurabacteria bacterium]
MNNSQNLTAAGRIIVALDCPLAPAIELAETLQGYAEWLKIGTQLYRDDYFLHNVKEMGYKIFYDPKHHDTPDRVKTDISSEAQDGLNMITLHASGGAEMVKQALLGAISVANPPILLAVTALTSLDDADCDRIYCCRSRGDAVHNLSTLARESGLNNFVTSAKEVAELRLLAGSSAIIVVPGIKLRGGEANAGQKAIGTAGEAIKNGATYVVAGSAVTKATNPVVAFQAMVKEIEEVLR